MKNPLKINDKVYATKKGLNFLGMSRMHELMVIQGKTMTEANKIANREADNSMRSAIALDFKKDKD